MPAYVLLPVLTIIKYHRLTFLLDYQTNYLHRFTTTTASCHREMAKIADLCYEDKTKVAGLLAKVSQLSADLKASEGAEKVASVASIFVRSWQ